MRRKILLLLLASVLVLPLCGCKKDISSENETIQDTQQDDIQTEEVKDEQDPDYMGDMYDSFASDYVEKIDLNYAENLSDGIISTQLNIAEEWGRIDEKDFQFINELDDVVYYYQMSTGALVLPIWRLCRNLSWTMAWMWALPMTAMRIAACAWMRREM